jgi:hypothetical protein
LSENLYLPNELRSIRKVDERIFHSCRNFATSCAF